MCVCVHVHVYAWKSLKLYPKLLNSAHLWGEGFRVIEKEEIVLLKFICALTSMYYSPPVSLFGTQIT